MDKISRSLSSKGYSNGKKKIRNQPSRLTTLFFPHVSFGVSGVFPPSKSAGTVRTKVHGWLWLHHYSWPEGHHHWPYRGKELLTKATWIFEARNQWRSILTKTTCKPRTQGERNQHEECLCNQSGMFWLGMVWMYLCMYLNMVILLFFFSYCMHVFANKGLYLWHWRMTQFEHRWFERMN